MASIIVVKTCDGDVYFSNRRTSNMINAIQLATDQVLIGNVCGHSEDEKQKVREGVQLGWRPLKKVHRTFSKGLDQFVGA